MSKSELFPSNQRPYCTYEGCKEVCVDAENKRLREFLQLWIYEGRLQSFEDRERFRKAAQAMVSGTPSPSETACLHPPEDRGEGERHYFGPYCGKCGADLPEEPSPEHDVWCPMGSPSLVCTCDERSAVKASGDTNPFDPTNHYFRKCMKGHVSYSASFSECPSCKVERERGAEKPTEPTLSPDGLTVGNWKYGYPSDDDSPSSGPENAPCDHKDGPYHTYVNEPGSPTGTACSRCGEPPPVGWYPDGSA